MSDSFGGMTITPSMRKQMTEASEAVSAEGAFHKKSFTAEEGPAASRVLSQKVDKLPESDQKTEMMSMLKKLASGGWSEDETKHFHALFKTAKQHPTHQNASGSSNTV